jgi:light-regulated signal transduction histidine kinase (bacteriophytochrome)
MVGHETADFIHPEDAVHIRAILEDLHSGKSSRIRSRLRTRNGEYLWIEAVANIVRDHDGQFHSMIFTCRDISEQKHAEEDLARSNAELQQFAYIASHDLQEPLRMVTSYLQLLERRYSDKLDGDAHEFIQFAVDGAIRMKTLINDLLTYSRIDTAGKEFGPTDMNSVMRRVMRNLGVSITEAGAVITYGNLPTIWADRVQMDQLMQNLLDNAIKYHGNETPRVEVSVTRKGGNWLFSVRDNGVGVPSNLRERIFLMFQRGFTQEEYEGTGIGLAISKKIVERHGGRIWVESEEGKGSTFFFIISGQAIG